MATDARGGGPGPVRSSPDVDGRPEAFAVLFAAALVLHVVWWHGPVVWSPWAPVVAAAAWLFARPSSVARLALLLAAAAVAIVVELPALGSHLLLVLAVAVCVLTHLAAGLARGPSGSGAGEDRSDDGRGPVPGRPRGPGPSAARDDATRPGQGSASHPRPRSRLRTAGELWPRVAPLLRAAVVVLYAAAVLSKLNDVYLDPATSPAGPLAGRVAWFAPVSFGDDWRASVAIWGSLLAEAALPVLLLVPRTRRVGLAVGLAFHGALAASGTVPFTALMLALYVGFLPAGAIARRGSDAETRGEATSESRERTASQTRRGATSETRDRTTTRARVRGLAAAATLVVLWLVGALVGLDPGRVDGGVLATATRIVVLGAVVAGIALLVGREGPAAPRVGGDAVPGTAAAGSAASDARPAQGIDTTRRGHPAPAGQLGGVFLAGTVALVLCGASPYLGWRAGDAFTMYSGLRTSPSGWNHVLLPSAVRMRD